MRGVHHNLAEADHVQLGSSPHARGPPTWPESRAGAWRIIPACAGSTKMNLLKYAEGEDHPRMRGVHYVVFILTFFLLGSSPHARGPPYRALRSTTAPRIIPACAGSTVVC